VLESIQLACLLDQGQNLFAHKVVNHLFLEV